MNIIAVDDEESALWALEHAMEKVMPEAQLSCFTAVTDALEYARKNTVHAAFLDIEMNEMNGLLMAKHLKEINPVTNIIFVTGFSSYLSNAFEMHASGYVMKPIRSERVLHELENLRNPVNPSDNGVRVQCFGNFAVFVDGKLLAFTQVKAKELLALLVHKKGADVSNSDIAATLWEDKPYNNSLQVQTRRVRSQLLKTLKTAGVEDIILKGFNSLAIDVEKINCDYYEFLKGSTLALNTYAGEYMIDYSWAELVVEHLNKKIRS